MLSARDEERLRRAIHNVVRSSRVHEDSEEIQYFFDLLPYLRAEARAVVDDEVVLTLSEIVGGD